LLCRQKLDVGLVIETLQVGRENKTEVEERIITEKIFRIWLYLNSQNSSNSHKKLKLEKKRIEINNLSTLQPLK